MQLHLFYSSKRYLYAELHLFYSGKVYFYTLLYLSFFLSFFVVYSGKLYLYAELPKGTPSFGYDPFGYDALSNDGEIHRTVCVFDWLLACCFVALLVCLFDFRCFLIGYEGFTDCLFGYLSNCLVW